METVGNTERLAWCDTVMETKGNANAGGLRRAGECVYILSDQGTLLTNMKPATFIVPAQPSV